MWAPAEPAQTGQTEGQTHCTVPLSHSQDGPHHPARGLGLMVSSQAVNEALSLRAEVGWPQDVTVPMSQPWYCPTWALSSSCLQNSQRKRSKMMGKRALFHHTALALLFPSPEQAPSQAALLKCPLGGRSAYGPCPQPPALSSRAAGPCRRTADGAASRGERDGSASAWMLSRVPGCSPGISPSLGKGDSSPRACCPLLVPRC